MANEITFNFNLTIRKDNLNTSRRASFRPNFDGSTGPTPGAVTVTTAGIDISLANLNTLGGVCIITNLDETNKISYGIYNPDENRFRPIGDVLAGESWPFRISSDLGEEFLTGTGSDLGNATLHLRAANAACEAVVEVWDK